MSADSIDRLTADLLEHQGFLRRCSRDLVGEDAADDLVQDVWVSVLERRPQRPRSLRGWLRTVLRNRSVDHAVRERRRAAREQQAARDERLAGADEVEQRLELVQRVADAVRALPEPYRRVVYLRTYEDRGPTDIARELGVPLETVHSRLKRGKALLRERLDRDYGGDRRAWSAALVALTRTTVGASPAPPASSLAPGALLMGSKTILVAAAGLAVATTLLVLKPWEPGGASVASPARTSAVDEVDRVGAFAARIAEDPAPAVQGVVEQSRREVVGLAQPATTGELALRASFASDGAAAAGARGHLEREGERALDFRLDDEGARKLVELRPGRWTLDLHGYGSWHAEVIAGQATAVEVVLERGIDVRGRVLDPDGRPVRAQVFLARDDDTPGELIVGESDGTGRFELRDIAPWRQAGPYTTLAARAPGYTSSHAWEAIGVPGDEAELVLRLLGPAGSLRGRVLSAEREPVAGAELLFPEHGSLSSSSVSEEGFALENAPALRLVTDASGEFAADTVALGSLLVRVVSDSHPEKSLNVEVREGVRETLEIVLATGGAVEGTVRGEDALALANASVSARSSKERRTRYVRTAADGSYRFDGLPAGQAEVSVHAAGRGRAGGEVTIVPFATTRHDIELVPGSGVEGVLVDEEGQPLARHLVCVIEPSQPGHWLRTGRTDEQGRFRIVDLPDGPKAFEVRRPEPFSTAPLLTEPWPENASEPVRLVVPAMNLPTASLAGIVLDFAGAPIEGVELWLNASSRNWGRQGFPDRESQRFQFGPLVPGDYTLGVSAPGHVQTDVDLPGLGAGEARDLGVVRLETGGMLHVELRSTDPSIATVASFVRLHSDLIGRSRTLDVTENALRSPALPPGDYHLQLSGFSCAFRELPVSIVAGETTRLEVELEPGTYRALQLAPAPQAGRPEIDVFDPAGEPFHGYTYGYGDQISVYGLSLGEWRVVVRTPDGRAGEVTFEVEELKAPTGFIPLALR